MAKSRFNATLSVIALVSLTMSGAGIFLSMQQTLSGRGVPWYLPVEETGPAIEKPAIPLHEANLSTTQILVVVTGTDGRPETMDAQRLTFGRHLPLLFTSEATPHSCVVCGNVSSFPNHQSLFLNAKGRFEAQTQGWYCAQQRVIQNLKWVGPAFKLDKNLQWLVVVDDDTFLHPWNLVQQLSRQDAGESRVLGKMYGGGAGFIFSRAAVFKLLEEADVTEFHWKRTVQLYTPGAKRSFLDLCIQRITGGYWCYAHSDHSVGYCAESAGIPLVALWGMFQVCPVGLGPGGNIMKNVPSAWSSTENTTLRTAMITCHYTDPATMQGLYELASPTV